MAYRVLAFKAIAAVGLLGMTAPAWGANLLSNPGFEAGYTTNWTLNGGSLNGTGLGEDPHSGTKSWHGAWNYSGSAQTTTYYQDVPVTPGVKYNASMWSKGDAYGGVYGNDTHSFRLRVRFRDATTNLTTDDAVSVPNNTWQQHVLTNLEAPPTAVAARIMFSYITTQQAHAWKVWNIDDLSFEAVPEPASMALLGLGMAMFVPRRKR